MKQLILLVIVSILFSYQFATGQTNSKEKFKSDSTEIAEKSLGFYEWYLSCLHDNSKYNIVQPLYEWKDTIPILRVEEYFKNLRKLMIVSSTFLESERNRFQVCQDSLYHINYSEVLECGCSVGEFFSVCSFIDYYYWISSQERYNGCEVEKVELNDTKATCFLQFFHESANSNGKHIDTEFICKVQLKKYDKYWLIDSIETYFN